MCHAKYPPIKLSQRKALMSMFSALSRQIFGRRATRSALEETNLPQASATPYIQEETTSRPPNFNIDAYKPMKVRCIGAGFSGILSALRFRQRIANLDFQIFEKQDGVGGTWYSNTYPGIACDVPSPCYQFSFENQEWSRFYAPGPEIQANVEQLADKYKLRDCIHLGHELTSAKWDQHLGKWTIRVRRHVDEAQEEQEFEDTCDVLLLCVGSLSRWNWPDIPGLREFGGTLVHSAEWNIDEGILEGKNVGVIGNGSSGIQIVGAIHPKVKTLVNYARQKTWVAPDFAIQETLAAIGREAGDTNLMFTAEELECFKDPQRAKEIRYSIESTLNGFHSFSIRDSETQKLAKALVKSQMEKRLVKKAELIEQMVPDFSVLCRRLTPGDGYLEALCADNTRYETTPIKRIIRTGVELEGGRHDDLDVLILATGFDVSFHYPFDIIGRNNVKLNDRWQPYAEAYMSMVVDGFPNMFLVYGPGSGLNSGTIFSLLEHQVDYIVKCVLKLQRERLKSMEPKREATRDWTQHLRHYFPKTVYMDKCRSWYTAEDGTVVGLWPGSNLHAIHAMEHPRWEDYDYERVDDTPNRLFWLGDGQTVGEKNNTGDLVWYLKDLDIPPIPQ